MKPRVLLVEDDRWLADSYTRQLSDYCVKTAVCAQDAIELIDEWIPQVIVADVLLEVGLVVDLLHELQAYADTRKIPVVLCSALASSLDIKDLRAYGVVQIIDKVKLAPGDLAQAVRNAC